MIQAIALSFSDRQYNLAILQDRQAYAKSSGARSGGGSFKSSPSSGSSSSSSSSSSSTKSPSKSTPTSTSSPSSNDRDSLTSPSQTQKNPAIVPVPIIINNSSNYPNSPSNSFRSSDANRGSSDMSWLVWLIILLIGGTIVYFIIRSIMIPSKSGGKAGELGNETFTVTKLQVALLAEARQVQAQLTELSLEVDTDTSEGLMTLMQESALALMRTPENWTHVSSSSQSVNRDRAESLFNELSLEERTKFSEETLVNVKGRVVQRSTAIASPDKDPSAYIVVTLLIGTEHDKPIFGEIHNTEQLQTALKAIAAIPSSHLLVFELLWSPQADTDSLTYDELLTEYTHMTQI